MTRDLSVSSRSESRQSVSDQNLDGRLTSDSCIATKIRNYKDGDCLVVVIEFTKYVHSMNGVLDTFLIIRLL